MKAKTLAEVVAGEMTHGPYAMSDALGIASVIANRAKAYGISPESVISAPGQFDAYNRSLPKGVGAKQIAMAQRAIDMVAERGPVTPATHYARPEATKNIKGWKSFNQVDSIPGAHIYAIDPEMRAIRTAQGVVQAQPNAFQDLVTTAKNNAIQVARTIGAVPEAAGAMAKRGYDVVTGQPSQLERAQQESAGNVAGLYAGGLQFAHPDQTGIQASLRDSLIGASAEQGRPLNITSGYRSPAYNAAVKGAKESYHTHGKAADIDMTGMSEPERQQLVTDLMQRGVTRFGTYTGTNMLHVDMGAPPAGQIAHFMHDKTKDNMKNAPGWFQGFAGSVLANNALPTPDAATAPTPTPAPRAPTTSQEAAYAGMAETMGQAGVPHIGLSPGMAASMMAPPDTGARVGTDTGVPAPATPAGSVLGRMPGGMEANIAGAGPAQLSPQGQAQVAAMPAATAAPVQHPTAAELAAVKPEPSVPGAPTLGETRTALPGALAPGSKYAQRDRPAPIDPNYQTPPASIASTPPPPAAAAIPADPRAQAYASMPPGEVRPSLIETGQAVQPAPALPSPTVVADRPVQAVQETTQVSPTTIAPAPTIAPAAPPPAQPGGLLGTLKDMAGATPYGRAFKGLASLAGPVPNPKSFSYGTGAEAINDALSGATQSKPGAVSYSKSTPGYSIKSLGNGMVEKTNQYGAKSYEHVGTPGSGILSGQPQPGGWRGGFGLSGLHAPSWGGMAGGIGNTLGRMALSGIGGAVAGPIGAIAAPMIFGGMLNNVMAGATAGSGGGWGWGNTANVGPNAMGFAGPWGSGGTSTSSGSNRGWGNTANVGSNTMGFAGPWGGGGASTSSKTGTSTSSKTGTSTSDGKKK